MKRVLQALAIALAIGAAVQAIGSFDHIAFSQAVAADHPGA